MVLAAIHLEDGAQLPPHHVAAGQPVARFVAHIDVLLEAGQVGAAEQLANLTLRRGPGSGSHLKDGGPAERAPSPT